MSNKLKLYLYIFLSIAFIAVVYYFQTQVDETVTDVNLIYRRIETPVKFWLNGYLGHFFNFKYLGSINWLLIPLALFAILKLNFFNEEWKKAIAVAYLLALVLISVKGYFNARYQLTLLPITLSALLYFLWLYLEHQELHTFKKFVLILLIGLVFTNDVFGILFLRESSKSIFQKERKGVFERLVNFIDSIPAKIAYLEKKSKTPAYPVIDFIRKELPADAHFLVNNLPLLYYYTDKKGIYYWCGDDTYYSEKGRSRLMENRTIDQILVFIKDTLKCDYLLSTPGYNKYDPKFEEFTKAYCKPIFLDLGEFAVYKITREKGNYSIEPMAKVLSKRLSKGVPPFYVTPNDVE